MTDVARAAALVLAVVLAWAGVMKLRHRPATVASFRGLGLPAPAVLATAVPGVEAVLALALLVAPASASFGALALLLLFSIVIARAVASGSSVPCACFGGTATGRPISVLELVRNGGLGALAVVATGAGDRSAFWPRPPVLVGVAGGVTLLGFALRRLSAVRR